MIRFRNEDPVQHGFSIFPANARSKERAIFVGDVITGPSASARYRFTSPSEGRYVFVCPIHPEQMVGEIVVRSG